MQYSDFWHEHIHEKDLPKVLDRLQTIDINKVINHEYRFLTKSGQWILVREELKLVVNETGTPKEVIGSIVDVSQPLN
jgi:PAS domain-containing protein